MRRIRAKTSLIPARKQRSTTNPLARQRIGAQSSEFDPRERKAKRKIFILTPRA